MKTKKTSKNLINPKLVALCATRHFDPATGEHGNAIDPFFSWSPCHCCGDSLGGDRYECEAVIDSGVHPLCFDYVNVCPACLETWQ
jgi:hypothetical protein